MSHEEVVVVVVGSAFHKEAYVDQGQYGKNQEEEAEERMENRKEQEDPKELEPVNMKDLAVAHQRHIVVMVEEDKIE